ncbi:hypothetical protein K439DRAFT_1658288 [Ramaria rubella]|nr:hypothetical protein K439DRAFT_1658288 [Ramaria rubella]
MECEESLKLGAGPTGILLLNPSYQTVLLVPAACTVVFYDYFLTLGIEIKLVWPFPWCMAKVLYFATTYFNFISMTLLTPGLLTTCSSAPTALTTLGVCSGFITVIIAEGVFLALATWERIVLKWNKAVLLLRTWVLWDKNNRIPIGLLSLFAFLTIPSTIFIVSGIREQHEAGSHPVLGSITFFSFLILAFYESIMLGLIIYKAKKHFAIHHRYSLFAVVLFRDGIMYYIILIVFSLTLTGFLVVQNLPLVMGLSLVQATLHSVLTKRMFLNLRSVASEHSYGSWAPISAQIVSEIHFASARDLSIGSVAR